MNASLPTGAGLYLHIPYCSAVCPYCDFAVQVARPGQRDDFVEKLLLEIYLWVDWEYPIDTIYLGGGTPSILEPDQLARILERVWDRLPVVADAGLSMEANPEDVSRERLAAWVSLGVSTLSLGVQSFDDEELRWLGRRHDRQGAIEAVRLAREACFDTVSLDLIFGLPGQDEAVWENSLRTAVALSPEHISCYQLTVHEGTNYARRRDRGRMIEMDEGNQANLFSITHRHLAQAGWAAYEVSNFARAPEHRSAHNRKYWGHLPYLGLGPSAHSFDGTRRWWNVRGVEVYGDVLARGLRPLAGEESLGDDALALETVMLCMRTTEGIDLARLARRFGIDLAARNEAFIAASVADGLLVLEGGRLYPTIAGLAVADGLAGALRLD